MGEEHWIAKIKAMPDLKVLAQAAFVLNPNFPYQPAKKRYKFLVELQVLLTKSRKS